MVMKASITDTPSDFDEQTKLVRLNNGPAVYYVKLFPKSWVKLDNSGVLVAYVSADEVERMYTQKMATPTRKRIELVW